MPNLLKSGELDCLADQREDVPCPLQGEETLRGLLRQVLEALAALHAANVTHRDVKPENLLVRP